MTTMIDKPFSQSCENNKAPILDVLCEQFANVNNVLEIGTGTAQHAIHFSPNLPHLQWHTGDQVEYHEGINAWLDENPSPNLHRPFPLSLPSDPWPNPLSSRADSPVYFDAYFTANTAHIMLKDQVQFMMEQINERLPASGVFCQYGPFTVDFKFNSQSNADFHEQLLESGRGGYRDLSELSAWAPKLKLTKVIEMPANNLMLVWQENG
jgi:hypothetical protein